MISTMKKLFAAVVIFFIIIQVSSCYTGRGANWKENNYYTLDSSEKLFIHVKNYFKLSEDRAIETWYKTYLSKCTTFYKIDNPTKDTILNLIKSYWVTSSNQKHEITKIEAKQTRKGKEIIVTMNYSYLLLATNTTREIKNLKLFMVLDRKKNVLLIKEISRG